jgi:hypothetical protein
MSSAAADEIAAFLHGPVVRLVGGAGEEIDMTGGLTRGFVTWMSLAMVLMAILIIVFLVYTGFT